MNRYLLDTNVLSDLMSQRPSMEVEYRFQQTQGELAISAISWHELLFGVGRLPASRRKDALRGFLEQIVVPHIPVLPYDEQAANWHASERARLQNLGQTPPFADGQIAAVAAVHRLTLVTRNLKDFLFYPDLDIESWH